MKKQRGASLLMIVITLLMTAAAALGVKFLEAMSAKTAKANLTTTNIQAVRSALIEFVSVNGRLPCPSNGALDTGVAVPNAAAINCTNPNGTVPWATLGLKKEASFDGWSRKISYRVYAGNSGMTMNNGANFTDCDWVPIAPVTPTAPNFQCNAAHTISGNPASPQSVLSVTRRPGLTVNDAALAAPVTQVAFVLISHGESGNGAWMEGGGIYQPAPINIGEITNTQGGAIYSKNLPTDKSVSPVAANHFDDQLDFMTIADLVTAAKRHARRWAAQTPVAGAPTAISFTRNPVLTSDANVSFPGGGNNSSGVALITLPAPTPSVPFPLVISTAPGDLIASNSAGTGIGVCQAPPATCNNANAFLQVPEFLSFLLPINTAQKFSMTALNLGPGEQFTVEFFMRGVPLGAPIIRNSTSMSDLQPTPPVAFDEVVIRPIGTATFFIQGVRFCDAGSPC